MSLFGSSEIDSVLLKHLYVTRDYVHLLKINHYYYRVVTTNAYFKSWKKLLCPISFTAYVNMNANEQLFATACNNDLIIRTKLLVERPNINIHAGDDFIFRIVCRRNHYRVAKWLLKICQQPEYGYIDIHSRQNDAFYGCLNNSKMISLLLSHHKDPRFGTGENDLLKKLFESCCYRNLLTQAKNILEFDRKLAVPQIVITNKLFCIASSRKSNKMVKWLLDTSEQLGHHINIHIDNDLPIKNCINTDSVDLVLWLIELSTQAKYGPFVNLNTIFVKCCSRGLFRVAKLLIDMNNKKEIGHVDINHLSDRAFRLSCSNGYLKIAKWLIDLSKNQPYQKINIHALKEFAFRFSCANGHVETAMWLIELSTDPAHGYIDIHALRNYALRKSYNKRNYHIAEWLIDLSRDHRFGAAQTL
jgi:hypothetical protein